MLKKLTGLHVGQMLLTIDGNVVDINGKDIPPATFCIAIKIIPGSGIVCSFARYGIRTISSSFLKRIYNVGKEKKIIERKWNAKYKRFNRKFISC